jgi:GAF domain-containing protein
MAASPSPFWNQVQELGLALTQAHVDGRSFRQRYLDLTRQRLGCSRVTLWRFRLVESRPLLLVCKASQHQNGETLSQELALEPDAYVAYIAALQPRGVHASDDCLADASLLAFNKAYLIAADVRALAGAALVVNGRIYGMLCAEELGRTHHWSRAQQLDLAKLARTLSLQVLRGGGPGHINAPSRPALPRHAD